MVWLRQHCWNPRSVVRRDIGKQQVRGSGGGKRTEHKMLTAHQPCHSQQDNHICGRKKDPKAWSVREKSDCFVETKGKRGPACFWRTKLRGNFVWQVERKHLSVLWHGGSLISHQQTNPSLLTVTAIHYPMLHKEMTETTQKRRAICLLQW